MKKNIINLLLVFAFLVGSFLIVLGLAFVLYILGIPFPTIDAIKEFGEGIKPLAEIIAIIVAGLWSYRLFIKNRTDYPYAEQEHRITNWNFDNGKVYLSVIVALKNAGNVLLELDSGKIFVQQIRPLLDEMNILIESAPNQSINQGQVENLFDSKGMVIAWRELGYREPSWNRGEIIIEPGEREEFQYDFILDKSIRTIKIISYFSNVRIGKPEIGWRLTSIYDLKDGARNDE